MSDDKTHYRKAFNSPYLSSQDIIEPTTLHIKYVRLESDQTKKSKEHFNTAHFSEKEIRSGEALKPMILNAVNSRTMKDLADSHFIEDWNDIAITVYVDPNVRFGRDTVEGLRISSVAPTVRKVLTPDEEKGWENAVNACRRDGNIEAVLLRVNISDENQTLMLEQAGVSLN